MLISAILVYKILYKQDVCGFMFFKKMLQCTFLIMPTKPKIVVKLP